MPAVVEGRAPTTPDEVAVSTTLGRGVGDEVEIASQTLRIVGLVENSTALANLPNVFLTTEGAQQLVYGGERLVASIGVRGNIGQANYSASKAGVIGLTRTLALELARNKITVNAIAPGGTETQMLAGVPDNIRDAFIKKIPLRRFADPEEIAATHAFLCSDEAAYITGQILFVDGGMTIGI